MDLFIVVICSLSMAALGLLILARNYSQSSNIEFALACSSLIAWTVFNYMSDHASSQNLLYTRLTFFAAVVAVYAFINFVGSFPSRTAFSRSGWRISHAAFSTLLLPITLLPVFISGVGRTQGSSIATGTAYPLFIAYVIYSLALLSLIARRQYKVATTRKQRQQIQIVFSGVAIYAALAILSNILLPIILGNWTSSRFGPLFTLIFVAMVSYAIVKRQLFDIRFVIVRSLGYILATIVLAVISFVLLRSASIGLDDAGVGKTAQVDVFVAFTLVLAILFQPFKKVFDRVTNKLFFRDAYDTQVMINELNQALVSTIILDDLLDRAEETIDKYIRAEYISIVAQAEDGDMTISNARHVTEDIVKRYESLTRKLDSQVVITDLLSEGEGTLKRFLQSAGIGAISRIGSSVSKSRGYVILGYKKSGNLYSPQDIGAITIASNGLALAVQNALQFEEIQQFNTKLKQKVEEATKHLRQTNAKLRMLDETKDDFISMASHQLRTPLTSVKGYISLVLDGDAGPVRQSQRKLLTQAFISSQRMVYLIADLLNVSRLKTGKFIIEAIPINLADIIEDEIQQLVETAESRSLKLTYHKPAHFPMLNLDETKTRQVIMNFIDNAIYYTPAGGHIDVQLLETPRTIELRVVDDGIGVPKEEQHHLFSKFYRAKNAQKARPDGTGLGLFMAKKVIVAQGGAIIFSSQEGRGSTFGFSFAKDQLAVKEPPQA